VTHKKFLLNINEISLLKFKNKLGSLHGFTPLRSVLLLEKWEKKGCSSGLERKIDLRVFLFRRLFYKNRNKGACPSKSKIRGGFPAIC
jgi:hypothetical protein